MKLQRGVHLPGSPFKFWQLAGLFLPFTIPLLMVALGLFPQKNLASLLCGLGVVLIGLLVTVWITALLIMLCLPLLVRRLPPSFGYTHSPALP